MNHTIVTVRFTDLAEARRALRMLKLLDSEGQLRVRAAALVERSARGIGRPAGAEDGEGALPPRAGVVCRLVAEIEDPDPEVAGLGARHARRDGDPAGRRGVLRGAGVAGRR